MKWLLLLAFTLAGVLAALWASSPVAGAVLGGGGAILGLLTGALIENRRQ